MLSENIILPSAGSLSVGVVALLMMTLQAIIFFRRPQFTRYAWSAAISFSALLYSVGIFFEYNTLAGPLNRFSGLLEFTAIICFIHCIYGFTFSYLNIENKRYHPIAGTCHGLILILIWFTPYVVADRFITRKFMGWSTPFIEPALGPLGPLFVLYGVIAGIWVMVIWIRHKKTDPKNSFLYLAGIGFWILLGLHDALTALGFSTFQYVMEYGFLGFTIVVLWVVFNNYLEIAAQEKYHMITEFANDCILVIQDGELVFENPACGVLMGHPLADSDPRNFLDMMTPENRMDILDHFNRLKAVDSLHARYMFPIQIDNDERRFVEIASSVIQYRNRPAVLAVLRDMTERKRVEEALGESEDKYRNLVEESFDGIFIQKGSEIIFANKRLNEMLGYGEGELIGQKHWIVYHPDDRETTRERAQARMRGEEVVRRYEVKFQRKDKSWFYGEINARPITFPSDQKSGIQVWIKDIDESKQAEEALRENEKKYRELYGESKMAEEVYRSLLHTSADAIVIYDLEGRVEYLSPVFTNLFGWTLEEVKGERLQFVPESEKKASMKGIKRIVEDGEAIQGFETKRYLKNGHIIDVNISGSRFNNHKGDAAGILVVIRDTSEKKKLENQLQRALKMEAIGTLAGGVAHDLNNILGGLVSYPQLLLLQLPGDSPLRKSILTIQKSGEKATAVVQDLLTLARRGVFSNETVNINAIICEYLDSLECKKLQSYHPEVHIETHLEKNLLNIRGSSTHLSTTIMNLVSNAAEAMPEGGKLTISTENKYVDRPIKGYDGVRVGDYVVMTVSDTGTGIFPDDMEKIFEPFYTKKKMGRSGTGLGMAVVWGTVKDYNGYIDVQSTEGNGTIFTLYFPITRSKLSEDKSHLDIEDYRGNGESILIVDDVEEQREIASGMLKELGYSVGSVSSGEEAVGYLKVNKVDLLLLDMIMDPGMNGLDTYKKILEIHPGQKAIIASGFSETDLVKEVQRLGAETYIRKPFLMEKLCLAVMEELKK
jgi:two-component system, cell cycle sensor histidine kinase and response regulator CckA